MNETDDAARSGVTHSAHWGTFRAAFKGGDVEVTPHPDDPAPSPILGNFTGALRHKARIMRPAIRKDWLDNGPGPRERPLDGPFVEVDWDTALDLLARELKSETDRGGPAAIYGGSYGWASAGRFHHAQSQIHRFLNVAFGGYTRSVNSYSAGASSVLLPHVIGPFEQLSRHNVTWEQIAAHTDMVLAFGGMAIKNSMIGNGGVSAHIEPGFMRAAAARGTRFHLFSPLRDDLPDDIDATWHPVNVATDTAVMLALAHTLLVEDLYDAAFVRSHTVGFDVFAKYLTGEADGTAKDAEWAAPICGLAPDMLRELARKTVAGRTLITVAHSLQRAEFGEQPVWAAVALAAMVGQIGLPGGGFHYALGAMGHTGRRAVSVEIPTLGQGTNTAESFIPVARIADMLLDPGGSYEYNGRTLTYPEIGLVYWAGGNPFHHHQDLNRLRRAFARPNTVVTQDFAWTGMARASDIVLPATMSLERDDIGATRTDPLLIAMKRVAEPAGEARDDYAIFCGLAERLGVLQAFSEGRTVDDWLRQFYERTRQSLEENGEAAPNFEEFWQHGTQPLPVGPDDGGFLRAFREDPVGRRLATASGKIEIFSETIAAFKYPDCPGHPAYLATTEPPSPDHPLFVVANAPATRLHSQLDFGAHSQASKMSGREVVRLNPADAADRQIGEGDIVRLFNDRGACLAAAHLTDAVAPGVVHLPTGAWYDPDPSPDQPDRPTCVHGNPNVLTRDIGTSRLAQGCTGQLTVAQCVRHDGPLPPIRAFDAPV
ncbi:molybdopterin-dependent oxidoreductase [Acuticoccus sp. MNP-M23]|uniref:molybdopterin-dependent oxidoreductase n=1 Tax=Acuticoccus sp. MNP-M23 TaxID=3072793 RepID=UPI0028153144|nr:molybdopterin-dependent oxidoreductase [Acuticoccus sp. MNP-M23]WMS41941.1 molybdopterin-dependent oxidoreductase [Acuticoccus sp. MNP-M23]